MGESLRSIVGGDEKTAQTKTMSKKQNKPSTRNMNNKFEEGCKCPECHQGIMQYPQVENCSCHINPPCSACTSNLLTCSKCGCEEPEPEPLPQPTKAQIETMTNKQKQAHVARIITKSHFSPRLVTLRKIHDCAKKIGFNHWNPAFRNLAKRKYKLGSCERFDA